MPMTIRPHRSDCNTLSHHFFHLCPSFFLLHEVAAASGGARMGILMREVSA
jgi:hypothetical protein